MAPRLIRYCLVVITVLNLIGASIPLFMTAVASAHTPDAAVTATEASLIAQRQLQRSDKPDYSAASCHTVVNDGRTLFYVFTLQPAGYIVVPASRFLPPVIAYSWTSDFGEYTQTNPLFDMLLTDITIRIDSTATLSTSLLALHAAEWDQFLTEPSSTRLFEQWPPEGSTPTGGWVLTLWTQDSPYKDMCPVIGGQRSLAGCPAVAMSQIVNYFNTTKGVQFTDADDYHHNYQGANFWIDNDYIAYQFPSWPQLNSYLDTVENHWATHVLLTNQDKAAINVACGFAMQQVYNPSGSGTFGVNQAYQGYQRFGFDTSVLYMGESDEMFQHLSDNMKNAIPAHIAVVNQDWTVGHNMVVDGYNTDDYYHINFGWGGSYNGWYHIPDDLPYSLTVVEGVIVDIMPTTNLPPGIPEPVQGPSAGMTSISYPYWVAPVSDPNGDTVSYLFDWGDGSNSGWISSNASTHAWTTAGIYAVKVKAKDTHEAESNWSAPLTVTISVPMPSLSLSLTRGGVGITATIKNTGIAAATGIAWTMNITGGVLNHIQLHKTGTIGSVSSGVTAFIKGGMFLGLGKITIELSATCSQGVTAQTTGQGVIYLIWVQLT